MKIRNGFVSNSSTSSFILAIREDISDNEKTEIFEKYIKNLYEEIKNRDVDEEIGDENITVKELMQRIFKMNITHGMIKLDSWFVRGGEVTNEGNFEDTILYNMPNVNLPKFKFSTYC